jgi:DNA-binding NarL/FixJ family response regulator
LLWVSTKLLDVAQDLYYCRGTIGVLTNILIVDDDQTLRTVLKRILAKDGNLNVVGEAKDGSEAVELALALSPDLILMDLAMPRVNGLEATRRIKVERPETKVIIFTQHQDDVYRQAAAQSGADAFLPQASPVPGLMATLRRVAGDGPGE